MEIQCEVPLPDDDPIPWRTLKSQNIVHKLIDRQIYPCPAASSFNRSRQLYLHIVPNLSVLNVEKPPCYLRKFSPNGRFVSVCFFFLS